MSTAWMWIGFNLLVLALLALDLGVLHRGGREIGVRESLLLSLGYVILALAFGAGLHHFLGPQAAAEYLTGYLIEKSLSVDNIFVFVLVFTHFAVPKDCRHRVLFWGILGALAHARRAHRGRSGGHRGLSTGSSTSSGPSSCSRA
jgi:Membrane protein TerC, possibly involved in tellurium resistance